MCQGTRLKNWRNVTGIGYGDAWGNGSVEEILVSSISTVSSTTFSTPSTNLSPGTPAKPLGKALNANSPEFIPGRYSIGFTST